MVSNRTRVTALPALVATGLVASLPFALRSAAHQDAASPEADAASNPFADLGLPEIVLDFTSAEVSGMAESIEAGRYLVTVNGEPGPEDFAFAPLFLQVPEGMTMDEMMAQAGNAAEGPPEFFYSAVIAGGPAVVAGSGVTSAYGIVDLPPGEWIVAGSGLAQPPVPFSVTGEMPTDLAEPESNVTLSIGEMVINVSEGAFSVGENVVKIENTGVQPHFVDLSKVPDGTTDENMEATIAAFMGGTPEAEPLAEDEFLPVTFTSDQSGGTVQWVVVTINEAGTHSAACWIPDPETMMPHAAMGMYTIIEVE